MTLAVDCKFRVRLRRGNRRNRNALMNWITVVSWIFVLVGCAMLVAAGRHFLRRRAFLKQSAIATGTIVGFAENREREEISFFPKVTFQAPSGVEVTFESGMGSSVNPGRVGDTVAVRYRTDQPHVAEIDGFMSLWGVPLLFGGLGAVFLFIGLGILGGLIPL